MVGGARGGRQGDLSGDFFSTPSLFLPSSPLAWSAGAALARAGRVTAENVWGGASQPFGPWTAFSRSLPPPPSRVPPSDLFRTLLRCADAIVTCRLSVRHVSIPSSRLLAAGDPSSRRGRSAASPSPPFVAADPLLLPTRSYPLLLRLPYESTGFIALSDYKNFKGNAAISSSSHSPVPFLRSFLPVRTPQLTPLAGPPRRPLRSSPREASAALPGRRYAQVGRWTVDGKEVDGRGLAV